MSEHDSAKRRYLDLLGAAAAAQAAAPAWLKELRRGAHERFAAVGFPTTRDEEWKYTDVGAIVRAAFPPAPRTDGLAPAALERFAFAGLAVHRLVFVNGFFSSVLSDVDGLPPGVTIGSLAQQLERVPESLAVQLGRLAPREAHGFGALNTALFADGALIHIGRGATLARPIHILYVTTDGAAQGLVVPRNLIVAEEGAQATVIENYVAAAAVPYLTDAVTEVVAGPGTTLEHYRLQEEGAQAFHVNGLHVRLERDSRFTSHAIDLGGRLVRNDVASLLVAPGAHCQLNGLYVLGGRQHVDNHTYIDHAQPHGTSREFYKGILDGRARAVFHGRIVVQPGAQQTDAQQVNNNLLLSRDAEADTKPQLEIYADDVKCSHGATVGQLDADALFYLRARALDEATARDLLTYAFARDVLTRITLAPVRVQLERHLAAGMMHGRPVEELVT